MDESHEAGNPLQNASGLFLESSHRACSVIVSKAENLNSNNLNRLKAVLPACYLADTRESVRGAAGEMDLELISILSKCDGMIHWR
jgi:hypothetical protein